MDPHVYIYIYMYRCVYLCIYYKCVDKCVYMYISMCVYINECIDIHIGTYYGSDLSTGPYIILPFL